MWSEIGEYCIPWFNGVDGMQVILVSCNYTFKYVIKTRFKLKTRYFLLIFIKYENTCSRLKGRVSSITYVQFNFSHILQCREIKLIVNKFYLDFSMEISIFDPLSSNESFLCKYVTLWVENSTHLLRPYHWTDFEQNITKHEFLLRTRNDFETTLRSNSS